MDTRIYIMTHKEFEAPQAAGYIPMQVGAAGKKSLGYLQDDTGENISERNPYFCELTGLYWLWKNVDCDIIGLCHYRRYFVQEQKVNCELPLSQRLLEREYIEKCLSEYDLIVPNSGMSQNENILIQYATQHNVADYLECGKVILEKYPQYYPAYAWSQKCNFISLGNMFIGKKKLMDEYCAWLFDILFEVEKRVDISNYSDYQKRIFGFLSERLFRVWMMGNSLKIREEQTIFLE